MMDTSLQAALGRLAPHVDDLPAWDDVVRRADAASRGRWKLAAVVVAMLLTAGIVAGALAEGVLSRSLDRLTAWVGDQPGEPAPEQQAVFDRENAASYAHFPTGTRIGRLLRFDYDGRPHELLGFRDGSNLCLRIAPPLFGSTRSVPECVPKEALAHVNKPVAVMTGFVRVGDPTRTIIYGLAADSVDGLDVLENGASLGSAYVENNAFMLIASDRPWPEKGTEPQDTRFVLRTRGAGGPTEVRVPFFEFPRAHVEDIPGPTRVAHALDSGSVAWLERGEARGKPFDWPYNFPDRVLYSRVLAPDPASSFRLGVAYGEDPDWRANGRWYCLAWFWPLEPESTNRGCGRDYLVRTGLSYQGTWSGAGGFPHYVGIAADQVARIDVFYEDGSTQRVPLTDNVFSVYVVGNQHSKLVAYDGAGRVVRIDVLR